MARMKSRLQVIREAKRLSRPQLAAMINRSASGLSKIERGERKLDEDMARLLAKALGVPLASLFDGPPPPVGRTSDDPMHAEVLRLWDRSSLANRMALLQMLRLAAAEGEGAPAHPSAIRFASQQGFAEAEAEAVEPPARGKRFRLHEDAAGPTKG